MADTRTKGRGPYGIGKIQRRRQLQLARESRGNVPESETSAAETNDSVMTVTVSSAVRTSPGQTAVVTLETEVPYCFTY